LDARAPLEITYNLGIYDGFKRLLLVQELGLHPLAIILMRIQIDDIYIFIMKSVYVLLKEKKEYTNERHIKGVSPDKMINNVEFSLRMI